jgi:hypothetical protein
MYQGINMHKYSLIGLTVLFFVSILFYGCFFSNKNTQKISAESQSIRNQHNSLKGTYKSVIGVMDLLSCYCLNGGYLTTQDGKEIPICFENIEEEIECNYLVVEGNYITKKIDPDSTNPCPAGEMTLFYVTSYECK